MRICCGRKIFCSFFFCSLYSSSHHTLVPLEVLRRRAWFCLREIWSLCDSKSCPPLLLSTRIRWESVYLNLFTHSNLLFLLGFVVMPNDISFDLQFCTYICSFPFLLTDSRPTCCLTNPLETTCEALSRELMVGNRRWPPKPLAYHSYPARNNLWGTQ